MVFKSFDIIGFNVISITVSLPFPELSLIMWMLYSNNDIVIGSKMKYQ